jgi:hypothetical protein
VGKLHGAHENILAFAKLTLGIAPGKTEKKIPINQCFGGFPHYFVEGLIDILGRESCRAFN